jgi:hypothetical protein
MESNRVVVAFERRQTRAEEGMTDVESILSPTDARVTDEETRARPRSRAIDGGDTKSPNDGVDASNREEDERNAVVGTCRVCLEDITREDVEMKTVVSLGCACVSSGRVHDSAECRDAYVAAKRAAGERACEICLRPLSAAFTSLERSKRALVVDIDAIDRSGRARVRDARRGVVRDESLDAAEFGGFARARALALCESVFACVAFACARRVSVVACALIVLGALTYARVVRPM